MLITQEEYSLLKEHEELLKKAHEDGYMKEVPQEVLDLIEEIYKRCYPKDVVQRNCAACLFRVVQRIARNFFTFKLGLAERAKNARAKRKTKKDAKSTD